jgi:hypothetical protein
VTGYNGLYFLGMPWLHSRKSGILFGVGDDAAYVADHIASRDKDHAETVRDPLMVEAPIFADGQPQPDRPLPINGQNDWQI